MVVVKVLDSQVVVDETRTRNRALLVGLVKVKVAAEEKVRTDNPVLGKLR